MSTTWTPPAVASEARLFRGVLWRIVEGQHVAATMRLVDSPEEQELLEALLEQSKPPCPQETAGLHYLLATPFRYPPPLPGGSRFRSATDPGVFYGARELRTAAAEVGYWRWRFLQEARDLNSLPPVLHTAFRASVQADLVDLTEPPLVEQETLWTDPQDYSATQQLARAAREAGVRAIGYASVRDPKTGWCAALLTAKAFSGRKPLSGSQNWFLTVTRHQALWRRERRYISFSSCDWHHRL